MKKLARNRWVWIAAGVGVLVLGYLWLRKRKQGSEAPAGTLIAGEAGPEGALANEINTRREEAQHGYAMGERELGLEEKLGLANIAAGERESKSIGEQQATQLASEHIEAGEARSEALAERHEGREETRERLEAEHGVGVFAAKAPGAPAAKSKPAGGKGKAGSKAKRRGNPGHKTSPHHATAQHKATATHQPKSSPHKTGGTAAPAHRAPARAPAHRAPAPRAPTVSHKPAAPAPAPRPGPKAPGGKRRRR